MTLPDVLRPHLRTAWLPVTTDGLSAPDASTFSGLAWIPEGETWPVCPNCGHPLQLLAQLNTSTLPQPMREQAGEGLIQVFYCATTEPLCDVDLEGWYAFSDAHVVRRVVPQGIPALSAPPEAIRDRFPPKRITDWVDHQEIPNWEERIMEVVEVDGDIWDDLYESGFHQSCDKLGGWPAWVQGPERPACQECGQEMQVLFQIDSQDHLPIMFGDVGTGHVSVCPKHADVLAFGWACG